MSDAEQLDQTVDGNEISAFSDDNQQVEAPEHWKSEDRELFKSQPKEVKDFILRRHKEMEGDYTRKSQEISKYKKIGTAVEEALNPYREDFSIHGLDEAAAIRQLLSVHGMLRDDPEKGLLWLADKYGYKPSAQVQEDMDPGLRSVQEEMKLTKKELEELKKQNNERAYLDTIRHLDGLKEKTDSDGAPLYPLVDSVKEDMLRLVSIGASQNFESAYKMAIASNKDLEDRHNNEIKKKEISKAKKASFGIKSSGSGQKQKGPLSIRESIEQAYDQLMTNSR